MSTPGLLVIFGALLVVELARLFAELVDMRSARARARLDVYPVVRVHYADDDRSVEGILLSVTPDHYRLADARQFVTEESSVALDGEAWVPRSRVLLVQRLSPKG